MSKTISCWATIGKRSVSRHLPHKTTPSEPSRFYIFQTSTNTRTIPTMTRINCVLECVAIRSDHTSAWIRTRSQSHAKLDSNFTTKTATVKVSDVFLSHQHARFFLSLLQTSTSAHHCQTASASKREQIRQHRDRAASFYLKDVNCSNIDECASDSGGCSHTCVNVPSSWKCICPKANRESIAPQAPRQMVDPNSLFPFSEHGVTYTASDAAGNSASCQITVNVLRKCHPQPFAVQ